MLAETRMILKQINWFPGRQAWLCALVLLLTGCALTPPPPPVGVTPPTPPVTLTLAPRLGLALGGGAARGFAHIGVIQELEREHPQVKASMIKALTNVMPRHLLDRRLMRDAGAPGAPPAPAEPETAVTPLVALRTR